MSIDATTVRYKCPFCEVTKSSAKAVREHITDSQDKDHRKYNGYTMKQTIETQQELEIDVETEKELHDNIRKAAEYFEDIDNDAIAKIAEEAGVEKGRVVRVFEEEGIIFSCKGRKPISRIVGMKPGRQKLLEEYEYDDDREVQTILDASGSDITRKSAYQTIRKYKWLKLPMYDGGNKNNASANGTVTLEGTSEDMLNSVKEDKSESNMTLIDKLEDAGIDYTVQVDEDEFTAIKKLIKAGYEDLAEKRFNE